MVMAYWEEKIGFEMRNFLLKDRGGPYWWKDKGELFEIVWLCS